MESIASAMERARKQRHLTKLEASKMLGCSPMSITMWERGVWIPGPERVRRLAEYLGTSPAEVLRMMGIPTDEKPRGWLKVVGG